MHYSRLLLCTKRLRKKTLHHKGNLHIGETCITKETYIYVFIYSTAQGGDGRAVAEATKGAHEAQQHSILVTQSCGQAALETQNFGRTTPCRGGLARIEFPFSSTLLNFSFSRPQVPLTLGSAAAPGLKLLIVPPSRRGEGRRKQCGVEGAGWLLLLPLLLLLGALVAALLSAGWDAAWVCGRTCREQQ